VHKHIPEIWARRSSEKRVISCDRAQIVLSVLHNQARQKFGTKITFPDHDKERVCIFPDYIRFLVRLAPDFEFSSKRSVWYHRIIILFADRTRVFLFFWCTDCLTYYSSNRVSATMTRFALSYLTTSTDCWRVEHNFVPRVWSNKQFTKKKKNSGNCWNAALTHMLWRLHRQR
jgi:hypothetical protein